MNYELGFLAPALKEWRKLDESVRRHFKTKLIERLAAPEVPSARLSGSRNRYKIKLRDAGYRLVYEVRNECQIVIVIAVGRRDKGQIYQSAARRDIED